MKLDQLSPQKEQTQLVRQKQADQRKELKLVDRLYPKAGQKTYTVNIDTLEVTEAEFAKEAVVLTPAAFKAKGRKQGLEPVRRKIIVKERHYYCVAINKQNALRKYLKALQEWQQSHLQIQTKESCQESN